MSRAHDHADERRPTAQERGALILHAELVATMLERRAKSCGTLTMTLSTDEVLSLATELYAVAVVAERLHIADAQAPTHAR